MIHPEKSNVKDWLSVLEEASRGKHYPALFGKLYKLVQIPSRRRRAVSVYRINKNTKEGDNVVVPAKILSTGKMDHKVSITALEYTAGALTELRSKNCRIMNLKDMTAQNKINIII